MTTFRIALVAGFMAMSATPAFAFGDIINKGGSGGKGGIGYGGDGGNASQRQGQRQQQQQQQELNNMSTQANTQDLSNTYKDVRQIPSVAVVPPSFGAAIGGGYLNACAGSEAWSVSLGASFIIPNGGAPVAGGIGAGSNDVVTINLCEVREAAHMIARRMEGKQAEILHHAVMCQHPSYFAAVKATGGECPKTEAYSMEVVQNAPDVAKPIETAKLNQWGRPYNEAFDRF